MTKIDIKHMHKEVIALKKDVTRIKSILNKDNGEKKKLKTKRMPGINDSIIKMWDNKYDARWDKY